MILMCHANIQLERFLETMSRLHKFSPSIFRFIEDFLGIAQQAINTTLTHYYNYS